ncbi:MAG: PrsW family glutamic-type intramembrane protease [Verrucomicrobiota bacterium]
MNKWQSWIYYRTREDSFLYKTCFGILLGSGLLGFILSHFSTPQIGLPPEATVNQPGDLLVIASQLPSDLLPQYLETVEQEAFTSEQKTLFRLYTESRLNPQDNRPVEKIKTLTENYPPVLNSFLTLGLVYENRVEYLLAAQAFEKENKLSPYPYLREKALHAYLVAKSYQDLDRLKADEDYKALFDLNFAYDYAVKKQDWLSVIKLQIPWDYQDYDLDHMVISCIGGAIWLLLCFQWSQVASENKTQTSLLLVGVCLGFLAAQISLLTHTWQTEVLGLNGSGDLPSSLVYSFAGIGLREELIKLLCFLPLLAFLLREQRQLTTLFVAAGVGLGFAIEENFRYFSDLGTGTSAQRSLMSNFFHMTTTGLVGLSLYRAQKRIHSLDHFFYVLTSVILVHGLYDSLLSVPEFAEFSMISATVFIFLSFYFFSEIHDLREQRRDVLAFKGSFFIGFSLLVGITFIWLAWKSGVHKAFLILGSSILSSGIILLMFAREFKEDS